MSQLIDQLHLLVLNVGLAVHNADWNWKNVNSPFTRIYYVTEGSAEIILPNGTYELHPGYLYMISSFTLHSCVCNSHFTHYYIHVYEDSQQGTNVFEDWDFPIEIPAHDLDSALFKRLCEINPAMKLPQSNPASYDNNPTLIQNIIKNKQRSLYKKVESRGIVYQLFSRFLKNATPKIENGDSRIQKAVLHIRKQIFQPIDIKSLAKEAFMSEDHFIRIFKAETGITPLQYIHQKKIEKAQLLLLTKDTPVKNIALMLSFEDQSYFNRLFKKITGTTPQQYKLSFLQQHFPK